MPTKETLIFCTVTDHGVLEVAQQGDLRYLYFGSDAKQSAMSMSAPARLMLTYTQSMMASLIFQPCPKMVLMIGLGGGSIAKFLHQQYPNCDIDIVEPSIDVTKVAHGYFGLPESSSLNVYNECGYEYVQRCGRHYDLIIIDAYDHDGMPQQFKSDEFFEKTKSLLNPDGISVFNLWDNSKEKFAETIRNLHRVYGYNTLHLPVKDKGNTIILATRYKPLPLNDYREVCRQLEYKTELPMQTFLKQLKRHNRLQQLIRLFAG